MHLVAEEGSHASMLLRVANRPERIPAAVHQSSGTPSVCRFLLQRMTATRPSRLWSTGFSGLAGNSLQYIKAATLF